MMPIVSGGKFISIGEKIRLPDDVTVGYIVEHLLGKKLTVIEQFHSHLEPIEISQTRFIIRSKYLLATQDTGKKWNVLAIDGEIDVRIDPTRFLSLHCHLFPHLAFWKQRIAKISKDYEMYIICYVFYERANFCY